MFLIYVIEMWLKDEEKYSDFFDVEEALHMAFRRWKRTKWIHGGFSPRDGPSAGLEAEGTLSNQV